MLIIVVRDLRFLGIMRIPFLLGNGSIRHFVGSDLVHFFDERGDLLGMSPDFCIGIVDPFEKLSVGGLCFSIEPYLVQSFHLGRKLVKFLIFQRGG